MGYFHHFVCDDCEIGVTMKPRGDSNPYMMIQFAGWLVKKDGRTYCCKCREKHEKECENV